MDRKLASICRIRDIVPIDGADSIETAIIKGWKAVVRKGQFVAGDLCVFCEIDSFLPLNNPDFQFLVKGREIPEGARYRIKTIKLRGQVSQGIVFPLSILPRGLYEEDMDVTEVLNITKWERTDSSGKPLTAMNFNYKSGFPNFIRKTDAERVQNISDRIWNNLSGEKMYATEKLDGTSLTVYCKDGVVGVCSRNIELNEVEGNLYWDTAKEFMLIDMVADIWAKTGVNVAIQGEIVGPGIQGNRLNLPERRFYAFNLWSIDLGVPFNYLGFYTRCEEYGIRMVPVLEYAFFIGDDSQDDICARFGKNSVINPEALAEGVVVKMMSPFKGNEVCFKIIHPEYLLKYDE